MLHSGKRRQATAGAALRAPGRARLGNFARDIAVRRAVSAAAMAADTVRPGPGARWREFACAPGGNPTQLTEPAWPSAALAVAACHPFHSVHPEGRPRACLAASANPEPLGLPKLGTTPPRPQGQGSQPAKVTSARDEVARPSLIRSRRSWPPAFGIGRREGHPLGDLDRALEAHPPGR